MCAMSDEHDTADETPSAMVVLISGPPGAGKSNHRAQGGRAVPHERAPKGGRSAGDDGQRVRTPDGEWTDAAEQQMCRAWLAAIEIARLHVADGVTLVIDDVGVPHHFEEHYRDLFTDPAVRRVMLKPTLSALEDRVRARGGPWDELLLSLGLDWCYEGLDRLALEGWTVIDSSNQSADETSRDNHFGEKCRKPRPPGPHSSRSGLVRVKPLSPVLPTTSSRRSTRSRRCPVRHPERPLSIRSSRLRIRLVRQTVGWALRG